MMARSGFLIDANLLMLLIVGGAHRSQIGTHRRLKEYTEEDYEILIELLDDDTKIFVTPNTLTEVSNLLAYGPDTLRSQFFDELKYMIHESEEIVVQSKIASGVPEFDWLGLTDAVLLELASTETPLVTVDWMLYYAAIGRDPDAAINFNHLRTDVVT